MNFAIDEALRKRLAGIRELGRTQMRPLGLEADRAGAPVAPDHPFYTLLLSLGLGRTRWLGGELDDSARGRTAARQHGSGEASSSRSGGPGSSLTGVLLSEEMAYWDRGVAVSFPGPGLGEPPVLSMGTPEQKERFLAPFRTPDRPRWGSFAMTEPGAGSDVAAIRTSCRRDGDGWILDGDKSFAANASRADWIVVWATVDPAQGRAGHRAFVVERGTPGLGDFRVEKKMGLKAYESTSFTLRGCRVPAANLLGGDAHYGAQRAGFKGALASFNATRPMIGAMAVGIGRAALDEAAAFARAHGRAGDPRVRDRLERIRRKLRVARLLCWRAAWLADARQPNMVEASMAKAFAPPAALEAASLGMELLGEVGGRGDHLVEKLFRDVKAMDIVEGTGQIQRLVIARQLVGLPRD
ncbi:MAG: acyl-CoA dehydrogenase [Proteobacteria bacterium]|nr:MAG: acyl-CoA dehydrogenase [Pseudomonadota bacterium]